ncbi:hypothetical protein D3C77_312710 [compost metagenome]
MQTQQPTVIYLDSCDYSNFSHPSLDAAKAEQLAALRTLKKRGGVRFVYSGAHISEMSPLDQQYANAAVARTELMVELCGRSTMIAYDRLMRAELTRLVERDPHPVNVFDSNGGWFPDMGSLISPLDNLDLSRRLNEDPDWKQLNRQQRRMAEATMMKKGGFRSSFEQRAGEMDISELLAKIPMRPQDALVMKRYVIGKATRQQAEKAFLESLRDPTFMSQWFINHHDEMGAIIEWVRRPAQELLDSCSKTLSELAENLTKLSEAERANAMKGASGERWTRLKKQGMLDVVNRLIARLFPDAPACEDATLVEQYCPGIFVCLNGFYNSLQSSLGLKGRALKGSDFVDIIHALYIPYVSFFRADRYMCSVLQPLAKRFGTQVVESPATLLQALDTREALELGTS